MPSQGPASQTGAGEEPYPETFMGTIYWLLVLIPTEVEAGHRRANGWLQPG